MGQKALIESLERRLVLSGDAGWVFTNGAGESDRGNAMTVDSSGNVIAAGQFNGSWDFDPSSTSTRITAKSHNSAFVAKYKSSRQLSWARGWGGSAEQNIQGIASDTAGNIYAAGYFSGSMDFDPGDGSHRISAKGRHDAFVIKLSSAGNFIWARTFGGGGDEGATGLATDINGNVLIIGMFDGTGDYDPGNSTRTLNTAGSMDVFVVKLKSDGSLVHALRLGNSGYDMANGISADRAGRILLTGTFSSKLNLNPGVDSAIQKSAGGTDVFVVQLEPNGAYRNGITLGGTSDDRAGDIRTDSDNNVIVAGQFRGSDFDANPSSAKAKLSSKGGDDAFVVKLDSSLQYEWSRRVGGNKSDRATNLAVASSGDVYITGQFAGQADFGSAAISSSAGSLDFFVTKIRSNGNILWTRAAGGSSDSDVAEGIAISNSGRLYITGAFARTVDFDPHSGVLHSSSHGATDFFLWQLINL